MPPFIAKFSASLARLKAPRSAIEAPVREVSPKISWLILALLTVLFIGTSFSPVIFNENEGLYAGAVREMTQSGDWLNPTNNGFLRVEKPPLVYWLLLASTSVFGLNEFALRLPSSLAISGWVIAIYQIMRRIRGERFGIVAATILGTILGMRIFAETLQPEPFLALFSTLCLWCLVEARFTLASLADSSLPKPRFSPEFWYRLLWVFMGLGLLSKGLHGAAWPLGGMVLTALFFPRTRSWLKGACTLSGVFLFLLVVLPWYLYMGFRWPGFLSEHFFNEQLRASVSNRFPQLNRPFPIYSFYLHQLDALLPWSLAIPSAILAMTHGGWGRLSTPAKDAVSFLAVTFFLEVVSLTFSTRLTYYGVSTWGIAAGFLALPWRRDLEMEHPIARLLLILPALGLMAGGAIYVYLTISYFQAPPAPPLWHLQDSISLAVFLGSPQLSHLPVLWTGSFALLLCVGGCLAGLFWWAHRSFAMLATISGSMMLLFILVTFGMAQVSPYFSLAEPARVLNASRETEPNTCVVFDGNPINASSLLFYLHVPLRYVNAEFANEYAQRVLGKGQNHYLNEQDFLNLWQSTAPVYLIIFKDRWEHWAPLFPAPPREVYRGGNYTVVANFAAAAETPPK